MKIKKILSVVGLSLFAVASVGAGVALAKAPKAQAANASEDDTWMTHFSFDIGEIALSKSRCIDCFNGIGCATIRIGNCAWNSNVCTTR